MQRQRLREGMAGAALVAAALLAVLLVDPRGDFPLNDDWCYARAVRHLLDEGELRLTDWGSMALLTQVLWGAAFSLPRGFSFEALRASTLTLGLVGLLFCYGLFRELRACRRLALVAALVLLGNPLFLLLAHTFMTDVPFLAFSMAALFLLVRGFDRDSRAAIGWGLLLALAATFVRQLGLALLVGFALAWIHRGSRTGRRWLVAWAPLAAGFGLLRIYEAWLASRHSLPEHYYLQWRLIGEGFEAGTLEMLGRWLETSLAIAIYLGLFVVPLAVLWMLRPAVDGGRRHRLLVIALATLGALALGVRGRLVPYFGNILFDVDCGSSRIVLGPLTLRDGCTSAEPGLGEMALFLRWLLTWLGLFGAGSLVAAGLERRIRAHRPPADPHGRTATVLPLATAASYLALVALLDVFDRYLLFAVPLVLAWFVIALRDQPVPTRSVAVASALALGALLWSVGAAQEYLDWNRARWRAIAYLTDDLGAGGQEIDGGFEFGGWINFDVPWPDRKGASWWWVVDDRYSVAFDEVEGYQVLARFPYQGWFGLVENDVLALRRASDGAGPRAHVDRP